MGMTHALQSGKLSPDRVGKAVRDAAKTMDPQDAKDFAETKHKGLPEKKAATGSQPKEAPTTASQPTPATQPTGSSQSTGTTKQASVAEMEAAEEIVELAERYCAEAAWNQKLAAKCLKRLDELNVQDEGLAKRAALVKGIVDAPEN